MTPLHKPVTRDLAFHWRKQWLVVRMAQEGIHLKGKGQRWANAYLLPWAAAYDTAVKMRVAEARRERRKR